MVLTREITTTERTSERPPTELERKAGVQVRHVVRPFSEPRTATRTTLNRNLMTRTLFSGHSGRFRAAISNLPLQTIHTGTFWFSCAASKRSLFEELEEEEKIMDGARARVARTGCSRARSEDDEEASEREPRRRGREAEASNLRLPLFRNSLRLL